MEVYVQLILLLALVKYSLNAALTSRTWIISCYGLLASLVSLALYPLVIEQPVTLVSSLLGNDQLVSEGAVLTTIEAVAGIFTSIYLLDNYFMPKAKRKKSIFILKIMPGILFCLAIAYFELQFFKWRVGGDFVATAVIYAIGLFGILVGTALLLNYVLKGESPKLELQILLNIAILVIGLFINSSVAAYSISNAESVTDWGALFATLSLAVVLIIAGFYLRKINIKSLFKFN